MGLDGGNDAGTAGQTGPDEPDSVQAAAMDGVSEPTSSIEQAVDQGERIDRQAAETLSAASDETAQAFDAARARLNRLSDTAAIDNQTFFGGGVQASYASAIEGMAAFNSRAVAAWRENTEATLAHWRRLASVKSLSEAIALSTEHTRQQLEAVSTQTRELSALATQIVSQSAHSHKGRAG